MNTEMIGSHQLLILLDDPRPFLFSVPPAYTSHPRRSNDDLIHPRIKRRANSMEKGLRARVGTIKIVERERERESCARLAPGEGVVLHSCAKKGGSGSVPQLRIRSSMSPFRRFGNDRARVERDIDRAFDSIRLSSGSNRKVSFG